MTDLTKTVLCAFVDRHDQGGDVEAHSYELAKEAYPDLERGRFDQELSVLERQGLLLRKGAVRSGTGEVTFPGYLAPTSAAVRECR